MNQDILNDPIVRAVMKAFPGTQIMTRRENAMIDVSPREKAGIEAASAAGGEYLDWLGKTDLATLTRDEWMTFLEVVITGFQDHLMKPAPLTEADAPF